MEALERGKRGNGKGLTRRRGERGGKRKKKKKKRKFETVAQRSNESTCTVKEAMPHATQAAWEAARETPAGSPTWQDERERTRQHAGIAEGGGNGDHPQIAQIFAEG